MNALEIRQKIRDGKEQDGDVLLMYFIEREDHLVDYVEVTYDPTLLAKTCGNWDKAFIKQENKTVKLDINK